MKIIGIIPARYGSTRLKAKPLIEFLGKPLIQHVFERAKLSRLLDKVIVATDNKLIYDKVIKFGGEAVMTSVAHKSGTDRAAEAASKYTCDVIVNIQGDEPTITPELIDEAIKPVLKNDNVYYSTLKTKINCKNDLMDPNIVKVITDKDNFAIYFSRLPIPYSFDNKTDFTGNYYYKHIGLYVYKKDFLLKFVSLKSTDLEKRERLEQLRALENGYKIKVVETKGDTISVDVADDIEKAKIFIQNQK
ncbi:MAG: 3-deoxy-manno-octulosonate cytidylyltransferase [bacterium]|nr:3-deoxy-manno-octulosonate cytidylyltransferase [bacterium]